MLEHVSSLQNALIRAKEIEVIDSLEKIKRERCRWIKRLDLVEKKVRSRNVVN